MGGHSNHSTYNVSGTGTYTKIGRLVHITGKFSNVNLSTSASGNLKITGLPVTPGYDHDYGGAFDMSSFVTDSSYPTMAIYSSTGDYLNMIKSGNNTGSDWVPSSAVEGSGVYFSFTMTYQA